MALETPTRSPLTIGPTKEALEELLADHQARIKGLLVKRSDELKETAQRLIAARSLEAETPGPDRKALPFVPGLAGPIATGRIGNLSRKIDRLRGKQIELYGSGGGSAQFLSPPYLAAQPVQLERENIPGESILGTTQQARRADGHIELGAYADVRAGYGSVAAGSLTAEAGLSLGPSSVKVGAAVYVGAAAHFLIYSGAAGANLGLELDVDVWTWRERLGQVPTRLDHAENTHHYAFKTIYDRAEDMGQLGGCAFTDEFSDEWPLEVAFDVPAEAGHSMIFATLSAQATVWASGDPADWAHAAMVTVDAEGCDSPPGDFPYYAGGIWVRCFTIKTTPI
jgi:hypothetical protein